MNERLLDIAIPSSIARVSKYYHSWDKNAEKIVIVKEVYDNVLAQENIFLVCKLFVNEAGVRLITVENTDKKVESKHKKTTINDSILSSNVSAGVLNLLNFDSALIDVWGVDNLDMITKSENAVMGIRSTASVREQVFEVVRTFLLRAQKNFYTFPISRLRSGILNLLYGVDMNINEKIVQIKKAAKFAGINIHDFPTISRYINFVSKINKINKKRVNKQMTEFWNRLFNKLNSWYKIVDKNEIHIDGKQLMPLLAFWMESTGQSEEELKRNLNRAGEESFFLSCKMWFEYWIFYLLSCEKEGSVSSFVEELMRLALRIGVPFFDLTDFREYIVTRRDSEMIATSIKDEILECCNLMIDLLPNPISARFREIEDQLDHLYRSLRLATPPKEAESFYFRSGVLINQIENLCDLMGESFPTQIMENLLILDKVLDEVNIFLQLSRSRGKNMVSRTLELMHERNEDRAILVVGGFHAQAIIRALEEYRNISWTVITPKIDLKASKPYFF
ncbi:hypothetical protein ACFLQP_01250 [Acidobacteriota bacterium]